MTASYSKIERIIARFLQTSPKLKAKMKHIYQYANYLVYKKKYTFKSDFQPEAFEFQDAETFFGYYDKSPVNKTSEYIIYHASTRKTTEKPSADEPILVVLANFKSKKIIKTFQARAYNWQQGAKPMWISDYEFLFNDFDEPTKSYVSRRINAQRAELIRTYPLPIYDANEQYGISINFCRLNQLRPDYGYRNIEHCENNDNIRKIDFSTGEITEIYTLEQLKTISTNADIQNSEHHKLNHVMFSPDGISFIFMHRYFVKNVRKDRLFLGNIFGTDLKILSDHEMVSHCFWINSTQIIAYMRRLGTGDMFYIIDTEKNTIIPAPNAVQTAHSDGHPHVNGDTIIFDTYPNKARNKTLFMYDMKTEKVVTLAEFLEPLAYSEETRCDLHPRFSADGNYVFVDSVHTGSRRLYALKLM